MNVMKKRMKILGVMMLVCMTMNLMANPVPLPWFPRARVKLVIYSAFKTHKSDCESGFGLCFDAGIRFISDGIPQKEGYVPIGIGMSDDQSTLYLVVDSKAVERFENGRYYSQFKNRGEVVFDEDISFPEEMLKPLGLSKSLQFQNRYPLKKVDGEYIIEIDLE